MFLFPDRTRQSLRARAEHPAEVRLPLRICSEDALARFVEPLSEAMRAEGAGRITGRSIRLDSAGRPRTVEMTLSLRSMDLKALETLGRALEAMGAPCGSTAEMTETGLRHLFGRTEGLGVALPDGTPGDAARTVVDAVGAAGRFLGAGREEEGPMLYFYGESFAQMAERITAATSAHPALAGAVTRRLT